MFPKPKTIGTTILLFLFALGSMGSARAQDGLPAVTGQFTNRLVEQGGSVSLSVQVSSGLPYSLQWRHDGTNLTSQTNLTLVISNAQPGHVGQYDVVVSTAASTVCSPLIGVAITYPMASSVNMANSPSAPVTYVNGDAAVAQLYAGPRPELLFPVGEPAPFVRDGYFSGGSRTIPTVPLPGVAYVQVWILSKAFPEQRYGSSSLVRMATTGFNSLNQLAFPAYIEFPDPWYSIWPDIRGSDGLERTMEMGENYEIKVDIAAYGTFEYRWQRDGVDIPGAVGSCTDVPPPPAAPITRCVSTLTLTNVSSADAGNYRIVSRKLPVSPSQHIQVGYSLNLRVVNPAAVWFSGVTTTPGGSFSAQFHGQSGKAYQFQYSSNLSEWYPLYSETNASGPLTFRDLLGASPRFYRAITQP